MKLPIVLIGVTTIAFSILMTSEAKVADVDMGRTEIQTPCRVDGFTNLDSCVVYKVNYEAAAPRFDLFIDNQYMAGLDEKQKDVGVIYLFTPKDKYFNKDAVALVWDRANNFVGQFEPKQGETVAFGYTSNNWAATFGDPVSPNHNVSTKMRFDK